MENKNEEDQIVFHILADRLSILTQQQITSLYQCSDCEFHFIEVSDELFKNLPAWYGTHTAYLKLLIGSVLPQNLSKIISIINPNTYLHRIKNHYQRLEREQSKVGNPFS